MDPATSNSNQVVSPFKTIEGPCGDSYANVMEFEELNDAVAQTTIRYVEELPTINVADALNAHIIADRVITLEDAR